MERQRILFLAANPSGTSERDLAEEARSIQAELAASDHRDRFELVTRWAAEPADLLRTLRKLKPAVVHFSGRGGVCPGTSPQDDEPGSRTGASGSGLYFATPDGQARWVSTAAIAETFGAVEHSVRVVVLSACYSDAHAEALCGHVPCVVGMAGSMDTRAATSFAIGFYGSLGDGASVAVAHRQGCAAMGLAGSPGAGGVRLRARAGVDTGSMYIAAEPTSDAGVPSKDPDDPARSPARPSRSFRIRTGIRTAFSDGHGVYLLALLAFGVAATFAYRSLRPERQYHEALTSLLMQEQEPFRAETRQVLAAAFMPNTTFQPLAVPVLCQDRELINETDRIVGQFSAAIEGALDGPASGKLVACLPAGGKSKCPSGTPDLGPAWTDDATGSTLIIPSTVADSVRANRTATNVLLGSRDIERYDVPDRPFHAGILRDAYFISLDGAIRLSPAVTLNPLMASRTFAGAGYWNMALANQPTPRQCSWGPSRTFTLPYLDVFGMGIVTTMCHRIMARGSPVGILCFDISPPDQGLYDMLREGARLFDLQLVRFFDNKSIASCSAIRGCPEELSRFSSAELESLTDRWCPRCALDQHSETSGSSAVKILDEGRYFAALVQSAGPRDRAPGSVTYVFGRLHRSPTRSLASAVMALVFTAVACGAILLGVRNKARRVDVALIRGLQVGVVQLDARDGVVGANDRAQEIFGTELPAFDVPRRWLERPFESLIHEHIVLLDDEGRLPGGRPELSRYASIKLDRAVGHSSSYYALTRGSRQVIRVSGSTFVNADMTMHTFGTVETFIDHAHRELVVAALGGEAREHS